jgi:hypothetical protein
MLDREMKAVDSDASILSFLNETHHLHDSCITSVEFHDGRFVDQNGSMHCGIGDKAALTLSFDSQIGKPPLRFRLMFTGVSRFEYSHDSAYDGLILSCRISIHDGVIRFECNEGDSDPRPLVLAKVFKYCVAV